MNNKTVVFDAQREIAELKRRVSQLESTYGPAYQPPSVPGYLPTHPPIFGPGNPDFWKIVSNSETPQAVKDLFGIGNKEIK